MGSPVVAPTCAVCHPTGLYGFPQPWQVNEQVAQCCCQSIPDDSPAPRLVLPSHRRQATAHRRGHSRAPAGHSRAPAGHSRAPV